MRWWKDGRTDRLSRMRYYIYKTTAYLFSVAIMRSCCSATPYIIRCRVVRCVLNRNVVTLSIRSLILQLLTSIVIWIVIRRSVHGVLWVTIVCISGGPGSDLTFWNSTHLKLFQLTFQLSWNLFFQLTWKFCDSLFDLGLRPWLHVK